LASKLSGIFFARGLDRVLGDLPVGQFLVDRYRDRAVWPDRDGRFPWETGFDPVLKRDQPVLKALSQAYHFTEQTRSLRFIVNGPKNREISMTLAKMMLAGAMLVAVPSVTLAQQPLTGTIITIDRISGIIVIRQTPNGTVGASGGGATDQQFKAPASLLDSVHAGDRVTVSTTEVGGKKTITKMDRQ
jgi:hypothetical protein